MTEQPDMSSRKFKMKFRYVLQDEFSRRVKSNHRYSLRAFAQHLQVSPSALSSMMKGKRPITDKMKIRLGLNLGYKLEKLQEFSSSTHGNSHKQTVFEAKEHFHQLEIDQFNIISDPHHYAILELIKTQDFLWDIAWISMRLQIPPTEVATAIDRLERVGILVADESGKLIDSTNGFSTDLVDGLTSAAQRNFQKKSLLSASDKIDIVPLDLRDNSSLTLALNKKDIPLAKKLIREFRRKFSAALESRDDHDEVYQITIALVPLTSIQER